MATSDLGFSHLKLLSLLPLGLKRHVPTQTLEGNRVGHLLNPSGVRLPNWALAGVWGLGGAEPMQTCATSATSLFQGHLVRWSGG